MTARGLAPGLTSGLVSGALALAMATQLGCRDEPISEAELHWEPCDHGVPLVDGECKGKADLATWRQARRICEEQDSERPSNWRLPTAPELRALLRDQPDLTPARRWTSEKGEDGPIALDPAGYPREQDKRDKKVRFRCVQE